MNAESVVGQLRGLSEHARRLLLTPHEPVEPPIRAELFGEQRFREHGHSLARAQAVRGDASPGEAVRFFPRVARNLASLRESFDYIAQVSQSGRYVAPAAEWLLDNFHLVEAQLQQIREGVPRSYYARLPKLASPPLAGLPRVYGIAWAYVAHTDSLLNRTLFTAFLDAYQDIDELRLGELWALPTTLRVVLLENLRRVAESIAEAKAASEVAHAVWDAAAALSVQDLDMLYRMVQARGLQERYLMQLWLQLPPEEGAEGPPLARWVAQHCPNGPALVDDAQNAQAAANLTVGNIITTLRMVGQVDWPEYIEPVSRSLRVLRELPSFARESELTRQQITQAMEQVARESGRSEREVALAVVGLAREAPAEASGEPAAGREAALPTRVEATAGHYLIGRGRAALAAALAGPGGTRARIAPRRALWLAWRPALYLLSVALGTALLLGAAAHGLARAGGEPGRWPAWLALVLLAFPVSEAVMALAHRLMAEATRQRPLPRLDFDDGIPAACQVLVAVPALLVSPQGNAQLARRLELHHLANRERHAQFALLADWTDAPQARREDDEALRADAQQRIDALNRRHPAEPGAPPRFLLLLRERRFSESEGCWMGWERKRGKLAQLMALLNAGLEAGPDAEPAPAQDHGFLPLAPGQRLAPCVPYVLTLDSDTQLPPGALRELVAVAAHPLNQPRLDPTRRRVTAGFGIFQPRILTPFPRRDERSFFHWAFAGQCGLDPYSHAASDLYQDVFGTGSFSGKGLLDVRAVHAVLHQRLPDDAVLSHDLLEGTVARCAMVSDLFLLEDHPHHAGVAAAREHRWTRGDWQLLPLMWRARHFGIDALGLWKMADNLRRSLVLPACALLLAWLLLSDALPLAWGLAAVVAALGLGPLLGALAALVPMRRGIELRHFFDVGSVELLRALAATGWQFALLLARAGVALDAIARAAWRLGVSRRLLLQWTPAAQAQAQARHDLAGFARAAWPVVVAGLLLGAACLRWGAHPMLGAALAVLWAAAPLWAWWGSRVPRAAPSVAEGAHRDYLRTLARDSWRFFEHAVTAEHHHLPPDNLQLEPEPVLAPRTSPTNIGMYLLSCCCAREFGWLDDAALATRLAATLDTVDRLERHQGHLYNWYHTQELRMLPPAYVSAVDSGNFAGHLIAVAQACRAFAEASSGAWAEPLAAIAHRCEHLCAGMDFRGLYDPKRHLFHIGLRVEEGALDASYYDLLASESRLLSFLAIAKGDVPRRHWMALGRPFMSVGFKPGLKSWSGSMFEYLMPTLVMPEPDGGLLRAANVAAVAEQQAFGRAQKLPWGVSESAYFAQDHSLAFQYSPFGVPRLALRRTPPTDRVVAPYATAMAAMLAADDAVLNLRLLESLGARGELGFFDAVDFTAARQAEGQPYTVVRNVMAHHHGMSLVALCNVLHGGAARRWFSAAPLVEAHESLLHERTPRQIIGSADPRMPPEPGEADTIAAYQPRVMDPTQPGFQPTHLLSNGRLTVALRPSGAGVVRWRSFNIGRWRDDPLRDAHGCFFFVRDLGGASAVGGIGEGAQDPGEGTAPVSLTALPAPGAQWRFRTRFLADQVQFDASGPGLDSRVTVLISPEDDTELRTVALHNTSARACTLELVSYFEPVLSQPKADEAHPAFANLFIDSRWEPRWHALLMTRKPRLAGEPQVCAAHFLAAADAQVESLGCMTDRRAFIGRHRSLAAPALSGQAPGADGTPVNGLDPVASLRVRLRIAPGATARLTFATAAAADIDSLMPSIDRYLQPMHVERATRMAATLAQVRLRDLSIDPAKTQALQDLATILTYTTPRAMRDRGRIDLRQIWRFGISGDKPIVLVNIHSLAGKGLVDTLLRAQPFWGFGGVACDLVVLNGEPASYLMPLQREIEALRARVAQQTQNSFPRNDAAGFYLLREPEISASEKDALAGLARAVFSADGRPLEMQVAALREAAEAGPLAGDGGARARIAPWASAPVAAAAHVPGGRFDADTGEFIFELDRERHPVRPWINVIANAEFGFQVSDQGTGYTWAVNSRMHQLTPWSNDPVQDPAFEHYLLQDLDSGALLPLTPASRGGGPARHRVRHGQGYSVFECEHDGLRMDTTFFCDRDERLKVVRVGLRNASGRPRRLRAVAMIEWQMGAARGERRTVHTWKPDALPAVFGEQRESSAGFGGSTAFLALVGPGVGDWTCERGEFFAGRGQLEPPAAFGQRAGSGLDACAALAGELRLGVAESGGFAWLLGQADSREAAEAMAGRWQHRDLDAALAAARGFWDELLGRLRVRTPDPLFDAMVNRWLIYQTLVCRLWAKAGFYQAGGAFGFRDQLQDAMAFALTDPARLRQQILVNAARQFPEGDVQHWWHMPGGAGVRTHFSDDLLWLPHAAAHHVAVTGDASVLDEVVPFLEGPAVPEGAEDAYYAPQVGTHVGTVYEHAARAIDHSLATGRHGLPLMGTGDWNDGMNRVGHEGQGESVWLGWFLCSVVEDFAPLAEARGQAQAARAARWRAAREGWIAALHGPGWDGAWFRRAFFDDGTALGSVLNDECRIDLIAQAWGVISGAARGDAARQAMASVETHLRDPRAGLLRLLHPPLARSDPSPGYIQAYPPGVRENGGQYSHGAVWGLMAQALQGDTQAAWHSFEGLSPAHRARHPERAAAYEIEPYVMAGDIYSAEPYVGRGGWSWYTGSAAWLHRAAVETLLGLLVRGERLSLTPRIPPHWGGFEIELQLPGRRLVLQHGDGVSAATPAVHVARGEWVNWHALPEGAVLRVG